MSADNLTTGYRRENFCDGFISMCSAIRELCKRFPEVDFLYPMHLNPNVRAAIRTVFGDKPEESEPNMFFIEPQQKPRIFSQTIKRMQRWLRLVALMVTVRQAIVSLTSLQSISSIKSI